MFNPTAHMMFCKKMAVIFCNICQQFDPCMHTNSLLDSRELGSRVGKLECMSEMAAVHPHRSNENADEGSKQAHSDLMTDNAGSPESSRICSLLRNTFGALICMAARHLAFASVIYGVVYDVLW